MRARGQQGARPQGRNERGVALLIAIISIAILTVVATDFAYNTRVDLQMAANQRDEVRAYYLAKSGIGLSRMLLRFQKQLDSMPLSLPGVLSGCTMVFLFACGAYVTPQILGGNNELLMPQLIMMQIVRRGDFTSASALSLILMVVVTLAYFLCARWLKVERT